MTKWSKIIAKGIFAFVFLISVIVIPLATVRAFSLISLSTISDSIFESNSIKKQLSISDRESVKNSQNLSILQSAVHPDPNPAKGGGEISVVENKALLAEAGVSGTTLDINQIEQNKNNGKISAYEVREGDSLSQIAEMFGVSVNTIRWANDLEGSIQPGQTLTILPISGIKHTIKYGGTVKDVAEIYNADPKEIALFNGLGIDSELKAGDEIIVPHAEPIQVKSDKKEGSGTSVFVSTGKKQTVSYAGYYSHPLPGSIITQGLHGYNAIDFGAPVGTPIYAAASGRVITSKQGGWNGGYGSYIVIEHSNGTQTLYSHQSSNAVYVGQYVEQGEVIGYVGSTGRSTGPHLHFEVRGAKNPWAY